LLEQLKSEHQKNPDCIETNRAIAEYYLNDGQEVEAEPYLVNAVSAADVALHYSQAAHDTYNPPDNASDKTFFKDCQGGVSSL